MLNKTRYRPDQVALFFGVKPRTVRRWVNDNRMKAVKTPGGHLLIDEDEVKRYLSLLKGAS